MDKKTIVNYGNLELSCQTLPKYRAFMENFFMSCQIYDFETNKQNYMFDLSRMDETDPFFCDDLVELIRAFDLIAAENKLKAANDNDFYGSVK